MKHDDPFVSRLEDITIFLFVSANWERTHWLYKARNPHSCTSSAAPCACIAFSTAKHAPDCDPSMLIPFCVAKQQKIRQPSFCIFLSEMIVCMATSCASIKPAKSSFHLSEEFSTSFWTAISAKNNRNAASSICGNDMLAHIVVAKIDAPFRWIKYCCINGFSLLIHRRSVSRVKTDPQSFGGFVSSVNSKWSISSEGFGFSLLGDKCSRRGDIWLFPIEEIGTDRGRTIWTWRVSCSNVPTLSELESAITSLLFSISFDDE